MKVWDVRVLYLGKITAKFSFVWPVGMPPLTEDFEMAAPYLGFLLKSGNDNILVDTGISEKFIIDGKAWAGLPAEGGKPFLEKALANEGVSPADIKTVVYTHLHNDHAANCTMFKSATIIFQKDEWTNLLDPLPAQNVRRDYDPDLIPELKSMHTLKVDGDFELSDGIKLYKTTGHTLGSQSIAVNTKKGTVVIIGDLANFYYYVFPQIGEVIDMDGVKHSIPMAPLVFGPALASTLTYNLYDFYDSIYKVKAIASRDEPGFILPGHEPSLVLHGSI